MNYEADDRTLLNSSHLEGRPGQRHAFTTDEAALFNFVSRAKRSALRRYMF